MSVLQGIKGTFQSVQQDLVDGFKALTSFEGHPKSEALKRLRGDGVSLDAGADLLYRYHLSWREIDSYSKESAKRAEGVDEEINKVYKSWSKQDNLIHHLDESVKQIPVLLEVLSNLTASIGELEESFRIIEDDLEKLEDVCEDQELVKQQQLEIHKLQQYRHQKSKEIEKVKVQMARDHAKRMIELEKERSIKLQERHEAFDEAFSSDLSYYKEHGKTDKLNLPEIPKVSSLSDISIDQDEKALNDFLSSQTTTPVTDQTIDEEKIDDEIHMDVVVTSEESFIDDDYTKDYGHEVNTVSDSESSDEEHSTLSGSNTEENSKRSGSKVKDSSIKSGSKSKKQCKNLESRNEMESRRSGSSIEANLKDVSEQTLEDNPNSIQNIRQQSGTEDKTEDKTEDTFTDNAPKQLDCTEDNQNDDEDLSEQTAEDNQRSIEDDTQQSGTEDKTEGTATDNAPKQLDSRTEDNQIKDGSEVVNTDKNMSQQSLSKDQNDNDSKVS